MEPNSTLHKLGFRNVYYQGNFKGQDIYSGTFKGQHCIGTSETLIFLARQKKSNEIRITPRYIGGGGRYVDK